MEFCRAAREQSNALNLASVFEYTETGMPEHGTSATRTASLQSLYTHSAIPKYTIGTLSPFKPHRLLRLVALLRQSMMMPVARHEKACISMHVSMAAAHWNLELKLAQSFSQPWILRMEPRYAKLIRVVAILCFVFACRALATVINN